MPGRSLSSLPQIRCAELANFCAAIWLVFTPPLTDLDGRRAEAGPRFRAIVQRPRFRSDRAPRGALFRRHGRCIRHRFDFRFVLVQIEVGEEALVLPAFIPPLRSMRRPNVRLTSSAAKARGTIEQAGSTDLSERRQSPSGSSAGRGPRKHLAAVARHLATGPDFKRRRTSRSVAACRQASPRTRSPSRPVRSGSSRSCGRRPASAPPGKGSRRTPPRPGRPGRRSSG